MPNIKHQVVGWIQPQSGNIIRVARSAFITTGGQGPAGPPGEQGEVGPQGEEGPQGPAGVGSDRNYVHTQGAASTAWIVAHNLGKRPSVTVVDSGDNVVIGDVNYVDDNNLTITFSVSFGGKAYLN